jgi:hypothetical protein
MFSCKEFAVFLFSIVFIIGLSTFIQVAMIVYGARNPTMTCVSPCILYECDLPRNQPYILPTPPIGINVSQALIVGGVIGIVLEMAFIIFINNTKNKSQICTLRLVIPTIPFLCAVAWMIVSFIVYTQTINLCTSYNKLWTVDSTELKWLLGANIVGFILLVGQYVLPWIMVCINIPCLFIDPLDNPTQQQSCNWRDWICCLLSMFVCFNGEPNTQPARAESVV